jgi:type II secretion system protein H
MGTSRPKTRSRGGFTLVELAAVLFVLGLVVALAAPRLSGFGTPSPDKVLRTFALDAEGAYDASLMTRRERRLVLDPSAGSWRFLDPASPGDAPPAGDWAPLVLDGIVLDGEERPLDRPTEVPFLPGGNVPPLSIRLRGEEGSSAAGRVWTLVLDPWSGTVDILEGDLAKAG